MLIKKIDEILQSQLNNRHSFFQLEFFIICNQETHQAKLHQCLVELQSRKKRLESLSLELDEIEDQKQLVLLEVKKHSSFSTESEIKTRMLNRKLEGIETKIIELLEIQKGTEEECIFIINLYNKLLKDEPLRAWDSPEVQLEYWNARLAREIRIKAILGRPVDTELIKTVFALPDVSPVKKQMIEDIKKNLETHSKKLDNNIKCQE